MFISFSQATFMARCEEDPTEPSGDRANQAEVYLQKHFHDLIQIKSKMELVKGFCRACRQTISKVKKNATWTWTENFNEVWRPSTQSF